MKTTIRLKIFFICLLGCFQAFAQSSIYKQMALSMNLPKSSFQSPRVNFYNKPKYKRPILDDDMIYGAFIWSGLTINKSQWPELQKFLDSYNERFKDELSEPFSPLQYKNGMNYGGGLILWHLALIYTGQL